MGARAADSILQVRPRSVTRITTSGLTLRPGVPLEEWVAVGRRLARVADGSAWSLGDWLLYGQTAYGERYKVALELTAFDYQTLRNYAWVARNIEMSRRRDTLSFAHHAEVAALGSVEQDLWLQRAEWHRWPRAELRRRLSTARSLRDAGDPPAVVLHVSVAAERESRWRRAAAARELCVTEWVATVADSAADGALGPN
jgi:hypothetical protein